jgi:hypothetical protein
MMSVFTKIRELKLFSMVFLLMYGPISNSFGVDFLLLSICLALVFQPKSALSQLSSPPLKVLLFLQGYVMVVAVANLYVEPDWIIRFARIYIHFIAASAVAYSVIQFGGVRKLFEYIILSSVFASLLIVVPFFVPEWRSVLLSEFQSAQAVDAFVEVRFAGIFRSYSVSYTLAVSLLFSAYLYSIKALNGRTFLVTGFLTIIGTFFNARAGWIIGITLLIMFCLAAPVVRERLASKVLALTFLSLLGMLLLAANIELLRGSAIYLPARTALEALINFTQGGGFQSSSMSDYLSKAFALNEDASIFQMIFGSGAFGRGDRAYLNTDNGYAFLFSGIGFLGVVAVLVLLLAILFPARERYKKDPLWILLFLLTVGISLYNIKEYVLLGRNNLAIIAFAYVAYHCSFKNELRQ